MVCPTYFIGERTKVMMHPIEIEREQKEEDQKERKKERRNDQIVGKKFVCWFSLIDWVCLFLNLPSHKHWSSSSSVVVFSSSRYSRSTSLVSLWLSERQRSVTSALRPVDKVKTSSYWFFRPRIGSRSTSSITVSRVVHQLNIYVHIAILHSVRLLDLEQCICICREDHQCFFSSLSVGRLIDLRSDPLRFFPSETAMNRGGRDDKRYQAKILRSIIEESITDQSLIDQA